MTDEKLSLVSKLAGIMAEVEAMPKDGYNPGQKFTYITITQMLELFRPKMGLAGIIMYPEEVLERTFEEMSSSRGTSMTRCYLTIRWIVTDGPERLTITTVGEAHDSGDKAANKAHTAAHKQALSKLFMVSADEDPDTHTPEETTRPQPQYSRQAAAELGVCSEHDVAYFQTKNMRSAAHRTDGGGWCNKPSNAGSLPWVSADDAGPQELRV